MTTTETIDVHIKMYRRDAQHYISTARRPAAPEVKTALTEALAASPGFQANIEFDLPRDFAYKFLAFSKRPIRLPVCYDTLNSIIRQALRSQPRNQAEIDAIAASQTEDEDADGSAFVAAAPETTDDDFTLADVLGDGPDESEDDEESSEGEDATDEIEVAEHEDTDAAVIPGDDTVPGGDLSFESEDSLGSGAANAAPEVEGQPVEHTADTPMDELIRDETPDAPTETNEHGSGDRAEF